MKRTWLRPLVWFTGALVVGGMLVSVSGIVPIKASSGHWPITEWFLQFSKRRSVATHSFGISAPPLGDDRLVLKGAGPFAISCSPCHGSPETPHPRIAAAMTPAPPNLAETVPSWDDEELFSIVKHGIKFTGMPAWPSQRRDDEVWALVAFLRRLPSLDAVEYQKLAYNRVDPPESAGAPEEELHAPSELAPPAVASCARCHGDDGHGRGQAAFPRLSGQRRDYLLASLDAYAGQARPSGIMTPIAYGLDAETRRQLADYYASQPPTRITSAPPDAAAVDRGRVIAERGYPDQRIPSCIDCHGPAGQQQRSDYPTLAGQPADYLALQLELFHTGARGGRHAHLMHHVAPRLSPEQSEDVARYFESLDPAEDSGP